MKRALLIFVMSVLACGLIFGWGQQEVTEGVEPIVIKVLWGGDVKTPGGVSKLEAATGRLRQEYPEVQVETVVVDTSDGSTKTMDAMQKAGDAPDVYNDYWGRVAQFLIPGFAIDLSQYVDLSDYLPGAVIEIDGQALGVAAPGAPQALAINLDLLAEVGYSPPNWDTWTVADFLDLCEAVKRGTGGTKWGTGAFAGNMSGDYLMRNWAASFGATFFAGNYSRTSFSGEPAKRTLEFFATLMERGYIPEESSQLVDDDYVLQWAYGQIAVAPFYAAWMKPYFDTAIKQGIIEKPFNYVFAPYPRVPGVERAPVFQSSGGFMGVRTDDERRNTIVAKYIELLNSPESQLLHMYVDGAFPNRRSLVKDKHWNAINAIFGQHGSYDLGLTTTTYMATRPLFPEALQRVWAGQKTDDVLTWYRAEMDKVLAE